MRKITYSAAALVLIIFTISTQVTSAADLVLIPFHKQPKIPEDMDVWNICVVTDPVNTMRTCFKGNLSDAAVPYDHRLNREYSPVLAAEQWVGGSAAKIAARVIGKPSATFAVDIDYLTHTVDLQFITN